MTDIEKADRPERLCVEHRVVDGVRVVIMRGEIDHDVRDVVSEALQFEDGALPPLRIVVDLGAVTFMDSSGINLFVACHQQVSETQGWVRIAGAQMPVLRVLELVGIDALITCHPSIEQALSA
ncbi:STAS domain-containing protein [Streptomyces sp. NPDC006334]|uniref:STAS domain-containing protein n=1 Tax=Streptomyces sp. NPDC006334 TaxID=3156754 RepID=UPI0033AC458A